MIVKHGNVVRSGAISALVPAGQSLERFVLSVIGPDEVGEVAA